MSDLIENRQIRIFISSTFKDMKDERDYLIAKVFPSLRRYCEERDITLFELDLRWGITEEESKQGKVVEICLQEIKNTRPFFIGILGESYGSALNEETIDKNTNILLDYPWIKDELNKGTSYTEIEIQEGVFRAQEKINAYFYFRSPHVEIPPDFREKNERAAQKLVDLKNKIREQKQYPIEEFSSKEELGQLVEKDFKKLINNLFPSGYISELEKERLEQRSYLKRLTLVYAPRNTLEEAIDNFVNSKERALVITGQSGIGKSALLANWIHKNDKEGRNPKILYHFIGISRLEGNYRKIRQRLINEIRKKYNIIQRFDTVPETVSTSNEEFSVDEKQKNKLQDYLFSIPKNENLVIILDGMDKLASNDNAKHLDWLPTYPENVQFIFSTTEDDSVMSVFKRMNYPVISIPALDIENRKRLITDYLLSFGKKLTPSQTDRIAKDKENANPMVLCALLDELRFVNYHRKLDEEIDKYLAAQSIPDFYDKVLERLEKIFDYTDTEASNLAADILSLLYVSRNGLSEAEIIALTGAKPVYWSQLYNAIRKNILVCGGLLNFSNNYIREAIKHRYFSEKEKENSYRLWIVHYLKTTPNVPEKRIYLELPYQLYNLGDQSGLYRFLKNQDAFAYWLKKDINELGKYCRFLKEVDKKKISIEFEKEFELEIKKTDKNELADFCNSMGMILEVLDIDNSLASKLFQHAMAIREDGESYLGMGVLHFEKGDYQEALEYYQKALNAFKDTSEDKNMYLPILYCGIGRVYYTIGDYPQALEYCQKALNVFDGNSEDKALYANIHNIIGLVYNSMGNKLKALEYGQEALNIQKEVLGNKHQDTATSYHNVGLVYSQIGDYPKAHEYFQKALNIQEEVLGEKHPQTVLIRNNLIEFYMKIARLKLENGNTYLKKGDYDLAIIEYTNAIKLNPNYTIAYNSRGNAYYSKKEYDKAIADYSQAIRLNPNDASTYNRRGNVYYSKKDYEQSIADYSLAIRFNPDEAVYYSNRGGSYECKCDYGSAIIDYNEALAIREKVIGKDHVSTATSYNKIGYCYSKLNDYQKAIEYYNEALAIKEKLFGKKHIDTAAAYDTIGLCYYNLGNRQKALECYREALDIYSSLEGQDVKTSTIKQAIAAVSNPNITLLASNVTTFEQAKEIIWKYVDQLVTEGYRFVDEQGDKSVELYGEFSNLNTLMLPGQIYVYSPPRYKLLISRGELGVMLSFTDLSG